MYGVSELQFRNTFERVSSLPGITGHNLLGALESRLDNMVYRMGFAREPQGRAPAHPSPAHRDERQAGGHPELSRASRARKCGCVRRRASRSSVIQAMEQAGRGVPLSWIAVDKDTFSGKMLERRSRTDIPIAAQEQLIVELYSK